MFLAVLFTIGDLHNQPKYLSTDEWIKQIWCIYTMDYYSALKKKEIVSLATI